MLQRNGQPDPLQVALREHADTLVGVTLQLELVEGSIDHRPDSARRTPFGRATNSRFVRTPSSG